MLKHIGPLLLVSIVASGAPLQDQFRVSGRVVMPAVRGHHLVLYTLTLARVAGPKSGCGLENRPLVSPPVEPSRTEFEFRGVLTGTYALCFWAGQPGGSLVRGPINLSVSDKNLVVDVDVVDTNWPRDVTSFKGGPGGFTVSGQIRSDIPAAVSDLLLIRPGDGARLTPRIGPLMQVSMTSPNDGRFEIQNLPAGKYAIGVAVPDGTGWSSEAFTANIRPGDPGPGQARRADMDREPGGRGAVTYGWTQIDVRGKDLSGVEIAVHQGVALQGRVTVDGRPASVKGMDVSLSSFDTGSLFAYRRLARYRPEIGPDGAFTIPSVPQALYKLDLSIGGPGWSPDAYIGGVFQGGKAVDSVALGAWPLAPVEIAVRTDGGTVVGNVTGKSAAERLWSNVALAPRDPDKAAVFCKLVRADDAGNFQITGIAPGEYKLFAWEQSRDLGDCQSPGFRQQRYEARGVAIAVSALSRIPQNVELLAGE